MSCKQTRSAASSTNDHHKPINDNREPLRTIAESYPNQSTSPPWGCPQPYRTRMMPTNVNDEHQYANASYLPPPRVPNDTNRTRLYTDHHYDGSGLPYQSRAYYDTSGKHQSNASERCEVKQYYQGMSQSPSQYTSLQSTAINLPPLHDLHGIYKGNRSTHNMHVNGVATDAIVVSEPSNDDSSTSSSEQHPLTLALPEDKMHLTALHCFVRSRCVYMFTAKEDEVDGE